MPVEFRCPHCDKLLRTPDNTRGKKGRCPHCKAINDIPAESAPAASDTSPVPPAPASPTPAPASSSSILDLLPLPPAEPVPSGYTPTPASYGGPDYGGGYNAPYVGPPSGGYYPHAAPAYAPSPAVPEEPLDDSSRDGLPWEDTRKSGGLMDTINLVLLQPAYAFSIMHRTGGVGRPLMFAVFGNFLGGLINIGYWLLAVVLLLVIFTIPNAQAERVGLVLLGIIVQLVLAVLSLAIFGTIATLLGVLIHAGIMHLLLVVFQGARGGFEATLRLTCYAHGSLAFLSIVPCVSPLVIFIMYFVVMIIGCRWTHEISLGKAVGATLVTIFVFLGIVIPAAIAGYFVFVLVVMALTQAIGRAF